MEIKHRVIGNILSLEIQNHITGISEVTKIKSIIQDNPSYSIIELDIKDAYVIPSMLIGLLIKEVNVGQKTIRIKSAQDELKKLLRDLNLDTVFEVR